jgi:ADP-ribose pyrophosphatase YjhB (NUDIX family)
MFNELELENKYDFIKRTTICFLLKKNDKGEITDICLAMKKRGFGEGKWNGAGGKIGDREEIKDETAKEGAIREMLEEFKVKMINPKQVGKILFETEGETKECIVSYIFVTEEWEGEPQETEEMRPKWFNVSEIPYDEMWVDDKEWFKILLDQKEFVAKYCFAQNDDNTLISHELQVLD